MPTVALTWQQATVVAASLMAAGLALLLVPGRPGPLARRVSPFVRETAIIAALYGLWQLAGQTSLSGSNGAFARARWIDHAESVLHLPSEQAVQHVVTHFSVVTQFANLYYASMHFTGLGLFLLWLFTRHRDRYRPIRRVLALTTLGCLLVQLLLPVAPPRMLPGFQDTAAEYGQSVYALGLAVDQLSAMPSVHVAWAVLIAWGVWRSTGSRWRGIGIVHAVITVTVVVGTANHFWADGIVAVAILVAAAQAERAGSALGARLAAPLRHRWTQTGQRGRPAEPVAGVPSEAGV